MVHRLKHKNSTARFLAALIVLWLSCISTSFAQIRQFDLNFISHVEARPRFYSAYADQRNSIKTIGIVPMELGPLANSSSAGTDEAAVERAESLIAEKLRVGGYEVVPASAMRRIFTDAFVTVGDLYDAKTGVLDTVRVKAYRDAVWTEYRKQHQVDALLYSGVVTVSAEQNYGNVSWHGVVESASGYGSLRNLFSGASQQFATVPALSIGVWLADVNREVLYAGAGGLHAMVYIRQSMGQFADYVQVAEAPEVFGDERVSRAIGIALDPLASPGSSLKSKAKKRRHNERSPIFKFAPTHEEQAASKKYYAVGPAFRKVHKRIALAPVSMESHYMKAEVQQRYSHIIKAQLEAEGFEVILPESYQELTKNVLEKAGMRFDTKSGQPDREYLLGLQKQVLHELCEAKGCDAILFSSMYKQLALFYGSQARWNGVEQIVTGDATELAANLSLSSKKVGTLAARSLRMSIADLDGNTIYYGLGGIELISRLTDKGFEPILEREQYADKSRDEKAVQVALEKLLAKPNH